VPGKQAPVSPQERVDHIDVAFSSETHDIAWAWDAEAEASEAFDAGDFVGSSLASVECRTCVGPGFGQEVRALLRDQVPTLIVHSVETAGYRPRQVTEYLPSFDFGKVYGPLGLRGIHVEHQHLHLQHVLAVAQRAEVVLDAPGASSPCRPT
jgi:hypothetical protein